MRAVAVRNLGDTVRHISVPFEDYQPDTPFAAVVSAQAFHWVDPARRLELAYRALVPSGVLAPIRNDHDITCPFRQASQPVYRTLFGPSPTTSPDRTFAREIDCSGRFELVWERDFPWVATYTTREVQDLVSTYSDTVRLDPDRRKRLLDGLGEVVERLGGQTEFHRTAQLVIGRSAA